MTYKELLRSVTRKIEIVDKFCLLGAIVFMDIFKRSDQMNDSNKSHARLDGLTGAVVGFRNSANYKIRVEFDGHLLRFPLFSRQSKCASCRFTSTVRLWVIDERGHPGQSAWLIC